MSQMKEDRDEAFFVFVEDFIVQLKSATVVLLQQWAATKKQNK